MWVSRAKHSQSLARVAWTGADLGGEGMACELYRQSAYWSLCALSRERLGEGTPHEYSESVWAALDERLLAPVAASAEEREAFRVRLARASFVSFAELPRPEQAALCLRLRDLAAGLLEQLATQRRPYDRARLQRLWRIGGVLLVALAALVFIQLRKSSGGDLAKGTLWRASSTYSGGGGCASPAQNCAAADTGGWFFHTEESDRDSWIEFEFDGLKDVSRVEVENRTDCCQERAAGLVIEVSLDHNSWQQVAERKKSFSTWRANFPSVQASWVRLRVPHKGPLHLKQVQIFR